MAVWIPVVVESMCGCVCVSVCLCVFTRVCLLMLILSEIKGLRFVAGGNSNYQCMRLLMLTLGERKGLKE